MPRLDLHAGGKEWENGGKNLSCIACCVKSNPMLTEKIDGEVCFTGAYPRVVLGKEQVAIALLERLHSTTCILHGNFVNMSHGVA